MDYGVVVGHAQLPRVIDPGNDHPQLVKGGDLPDLQAFEVPVLHGDARVYERGRHFFRVHFQQVLLGLGAEEPPDEHHGQDHAQDGARVGQGVAHGGAVGGLGAHRAQRLLRRGERRGIGDRAGVHAHGGSHVQAGQPRHGQRDAYAAQHHGRGHQVKLYALLLEGGEEARPHLGADGIDEKNEAEVPQELQRAMVYLQAEMAEEDAREQHPGYPEVYAQELYIAYRQAAGGHQHDDEHRPGHGLGGEERGEQVHRIILSK